MGKKKGGRSAYFNKHNGFYLSPKKTEKEKSESRSDTSAKGISMKNSNVSHRTCQG